MNDLAESVAQAHEVFAKSTSTLEAVHKQVLPHDPLPGDVDGFLGVLGPGSSMMASFARALTVRGSESTFKMLLAHGIPSDFATAMADLPRRVNGKTVSLKPVTQQAETFMATMERLAAEAVCRASRGASESAMER